MRKYIERTLQNPNVMLNQTKYILTLFVALIFTVGLSAQIEQTESSPSKFKKPGWWTIGLNAGSSYQSSDVCRTYEGWGLGLTLAKNLYYKPGAPLAFDLRGRLLYANQIGADHERSYGLLYNEALNGTLREFDTSFPLDYYDETAPEDSYVYANHRTDLFEVGLEGVFNLNRLKEKTNVIVNLYGGLNLDWYKTRTDQATSLGDVYDYSIINPESGRGSIRNQLGSVRDGNYETVADGFDNDYGTITWMPSAGLELGYQLTPRFSIIGGHKVTWSRDDIMDGQRWNDNNEATGNNDLYHYTHLGLRWEVRPYDKELEPPIIEIERPLPLPHTTDIPNITVLADIKNLSSANDVKCTLNGKPFYGFSFNPKSRDYSTNFNLEEGKNILNITATNMAGSDSEDVVIYYTPAESPKQPPVVNITRPSKDDTKVDRPEYNLVASVKHVKSKSDIQFYLNGNTTTDFTYSTSRNEVKAALNLQEGKNVVKIIATNTDGTDQDQTSIIYEVDDCPEPTASIDNISKPIATSNPAYGTADLRATVRNVSSRSDIRIYINGDRMTDFVYDVNRNEVTAKLEVERGNNVVEIRVKTSCGEDTDKEDVGYHTATTPTNPTTPTTPTSPTTPTYPTPQGQAPVVEIVSPMNGHTTSQSSVNVSATVRNVTSKNQIRIKINNQTQNSFNYSSYNGTVTFNASLNNGNNSIKVIASNSYGSDNDDILVIKQTQTTTPTTPTSPTSPTSPCTDPVVKIQNITIPTPISGNPDKAKSNLRGLVKHVSSKSQIKVFINNSRFYNFNYNASTDELTATITLNKGNNHVRIVGQSSCGKDEDSENLTYTPPSTPNTPTTPTTPTPTVSKPTVKITRPFKGNSVSQPNLSVAATVTNVDGKSNIKFLLNNQTFSNFSYNATTDQLTASVTLNEGSNTIKIIGTNSAGSASDIKTITYVKPTPKPIVTIKNPSSPGKKVTKKAFAFKGNVKNISSKNNVVFKFNGKIASFSFDKNTGNVSANVTLKKGTNNFYLEGTNSAGKDSKNSSVVYEPLIAKPTVEITDLSMPVATPMNPTPTQNTLKAKCTGVSAKKDITIKLNGQKITDFMFNRNLGLINAKLQLVNGPNSIIVEVKNASGTAQDTMEVNF